MALVLQLNEAAGLIFEEWIRDNDRAVRVAASLYKGFLGKLRGMVLRPSLVAELIAWAAGTMGVAVNGGGSGGASSQ